MARESDIELDVVKWAEDNRWQVRKMQYVGRVGCPDRMFVGFGHVIFMELKAPGEKPSATQTREHMRFEEAGVTVHVVDAVEDGVAVLRFAMDHSASPLAFT